MVPRQPPLPLPSSKLAVTLFVFAAGTAWTRLVAPDFGLLANHLLHGGGGHPFIVLLIHSRRMLVVHDLLLAAVRLHGLDFFLLPNLHAHKEADYIPLDAVEHLRKHLERFNLVFLLGILLRVGAQMDALTQVIHGRKMLLPLLVKHLQHDRLLEMLHDALAYHGRFSFVTLVD